jgi:hypothetical protein
VEHHRYAITGRLQVAFDAVSTLDGGTKGWRRILDKARTYVVQASMRDGAPESVAEPARQVWRTAWAVPFHSNHQRSPRRSRRAGPLSFA